MEMMYTRFLFTYLSKLFHDHGWGSHDIAYFSNFLMEDEEDPDICFYGIELLLKICHATNYIEDYDTSVYVYTHESMYEYNRLCQQYEELTGTEKKNIGFISEMEDEVSIMFQTILERLGKTFSYSYEYQIYTGTKYPVNSCIAVFANSDFFSPLELSIAFLHIALHYKERSVELKHKLEMISCNKKLLKEAA